MKSPAFQFYPADYLADMQVRLLSWASRGLYIDLLCYCWREGYIPADSSAIAQLCGCHDLAIVQPCLLLFTEHPDDQSKLIHGRLEKERMKQLEHKNERSISGKRGAKSRWGNKKASQKRSNSKANGSANGSAIVLPMAKNGSSSSSSTSVLVSTKVDTPLPFDSPDFKLFWANWEQHRKETKKPITPTSRKQQFAKLAEMGERRAIEALKHSLAGGYAGIYEPSTSKPNGSTHNDRHHGETEILEIPMLKTQY